MFLFCLVLTLTNCLFNSAGDAVNEKSDVAVTQGTILAAIIANRLEWGQVYAFF